MQRAFEKAHKARFGFIDRNKEMVVEAVSVEAIGGGAKFNEKTLRKSTRQAARAGARARASSRRANGTRPTSTRASSSSPAPRSRAPAIIIEPHQTIVVEPGWQAEITAKNHLVLTRVRQLKRTHAIGTQADPVMLEVFNNLFMSIAEQMGVSLQNTAYSVNIKERLDFSCAVFADDGTLVANAPHMPVHLGSMDRSVETIIRDNKGKIKPGDVYVINAPYNGGTHLPDITVCTPVFDDRKKNILFWVASRGHHADVGGISPGSMSPNATTIEEEGVLFDNFKLVDRGRFREKELMDAADWAPNIRRATRSRTSTTSRRRSPPTRRASPSCARWSTQFTLPVVKAYMQHVQDNAAESVRRVIDRLHDCDIRLRDGPGHRHQGEDHGRQEEARGDRRLHRHLAAAADQLQRAGAGDARRRALRVPRHGRRRHPDERRLPAADQHRHPEEARC